MTHAANDLIAGKPPPRRRWELYWLAALTGLSAFLCFNRLGFPAPLIDESLTYWRVCGSLNQLLDTLRNDAFVPLHYEVINWIGQGFPIGKWPLIPGGILLTPAMLRVFPAICGTALTPVVYFLARQMFDRRTAVYAAALMACSAYGLFFSHNAKMYAPAWMTATLAIACFLWWVRTGRRLAWLCWIAAGVASAGIHAITLLLAPLFPLYFLTMRKISARAAAGLVVGLAVIAAGPALYYGVFNQWTQNSGGIVPGVGAEPAPDANWVNGGLAWIGPIYDGVGPPLRALDTYVSGFEWQSFDELAYPPDIVARFGSAMIALGAITYGLFLLGALPWPHLRKRREVEPRALLWLGAWIVLPVYGFFYCRSVNPFSTPVDWIEWGWGLMGWQWLAAGALAGAIVAGLQWAPRAAKWVGVLPLLAIVYCIEQAARNRWGWMDYFSYLAVSVAAAGVMGAILFHYGGQSFAERVRRALRLVGTVALILVLCEGAAIGWRWLHAYSMRKHPELPWQSIWHVRYVAIVMPAVWAAAAALLARLPTRALQIAAVAMICSYNVANALARQYIPTAPTLDRVMADAYLSQAGSEVRTYLDVNEVTHSEYFRPLAAYSAVMAAEMRLTPVEFRKGRLWPFELGSFAAEFTRRCIFNPTFTAEKIHGDIAGHPEIRRVIVWQVPSRSFLGFGPADGAVRGLGAGWERASDETIQCYDYWSWNVEATLRRREFVRK